MSDHSTVSNLLGESFQLPTCLPFILRIVNIITYAYSDHGRNWIVDSPAPVLRDLDLHCQVSHSHTLDKLFWFKIPVYCKVRLLPLHFYCQWMLLFLLQFYTQAVFTSLLSLRFLRDSAMCHTCLKIRNGFCLLLILYWGAKYFLTIVQVFYLKSTESVVA